MYVMYLRSYQVIGKNLQRMAKNKKVLEIFVIVDIEQGKEDAVALGVVIRF